MLCTYMWEEGVGVAVCGGGARTGGPTKYWALLIAFLFRALASPCGWCLMYFESYQYTFWCMQCP